MLWKRETGNYSSKLYCSRCLLQLFIRLTVLTRLANLVTVNKANKHSFSIKKFVIKLSHKF
jgi:hypothetical protein